MNPTNPYGPLTATCQHCYQAPATETIAYVVLHEYKNEKSRIDSVCGPCGTVWSKSLR